MGSALTIYTYDWVPGGEHGPRGYVRDVRLRWACEEAGLAYDVQSVPFKDRGAEHFAHQPYGQVPYLQDGDISIFESGACLLHLAKKSEALMPRDPKGEAEALEWTISALNSIEMVSVPWWFISLSGVEKNPLEQWMMSRLNHLDAVLSKRDYLAAGRFTVADIMMADALRVPKVLAAATEKHPALRTYVDRILARPAFIKARADQIEHFAKADG